MREAVLDPITTITIPVRKSVVTPIANDTPRLEDCETTIRCNQASVWEVANAVCEIADKKLYQAAGFQNFKDYCKLRLKIHWRWAMRLRKANQGRAAIEDACARIAALKSDQAVQDAPGGLKPPGEQDGQSEAPATEIQDTSGPSISVFAALEVAALPAQQQAAAADVLVASAQKNSSSQITVSDARAVATAVANQAATAVAKPKKSDAVIAAEQAITNGQHAKDVLKQIRAAMKSLRNLPPLSGLEIINQRKDSILHHLEQAANAVTAYTPAEICPKCKGERCPDCGNHGWLNRSAQRAITNQRT
jgi:hypothetical protein